MPLWQAPRWQRRWRPRRPRIAPTTATAASSAIAADTEAGRRRPRCRPPRLTRCRADIREDDFPVAPHLLRTRNNPTNRTDPRSEDPPAPSTAPVSNNSNRPVPRRTIARVNPRGVNTDRSRSQRHPHQRLPQQQQQQRYLPRVHLHQHRYRLHQHLPPAISHCFIPSMVTTHPQTVFWPGHTLSS